jgi:hypothetical protein
VAGLPGDMAGFDDVSTFAAAFRELNGPRVPNAR